MFCMTEKDTLRTYMRHDRSCSATPLSKHTCSVHARYRFVKS